MGMIRKSIRDGAKYCNMGKSDIKLRSDTSGGDVMPRQKSGEFDQNKYVAGYLKNNIKLVHISLNKTKEEDRRILEWLQNRPEGASGYLKKLILKDMGSGG